MFCSRPSPVLIRGCLGRRGSAVSGARACRPAARRRCLRRFLDASGFLWERRGVPGGEVLLSHLPACGSPHSLNGIRPRRVCSRPALFPPPCYHHSHAGVQTVNLAPTAQVSTFPLTPFLPRTPPTDAHAHTPGF